MGVVPVLKKNLSQSAKENLRTYLNQLQRKNVKKLPPETELAKMLSVSRATIRQALDDLEREGLLLRIHVLLSLPSGPCCERLRGYVITEPA